MSSLSGGFVMSGVLNVVSGLAAKHSRRHHDSCRAEALDGWEISRFAAGTYMLNGPSLHHDPVGYPVSSCLGLAAGELPRSQRTRNATRDARRHFLSAESVTTATLFTCLW